MKIAVFGGTFNPIHNGHLALANTAVEKFALDTVLFVPTYLPPHKLDTDLTSAEDRYEMIKLAIDGAEHLEACRLEINRRNISYSIDTLTFLKKIYPEDTQIFFLIGSDAADKLGEWKDIDKIFSLCTFIVGMRPDYAFAANYKNIEVMPMDPVDVSSTMIRQMLKEKASIGGLVPDKVAGFIEQYKLYE
ncbi:MAG: nicotinate-nucleotide adenylyltransferase [Candidatus Omnitrophota bacterium]